jgi:hypothetical protein
LTADLTERMQDNRLLTDRYKAPIRTSRQRVARRAVHVQTGRVDGPFRRWIPVATHVILHSQRLGRIPYHTLAKLILDGS